MMNPIDVSDLLLYHNEVVVVFCFFTTTIRWIAIKSGTIVIYSLLWYMNKHLQNRTFQ